MEEDESERRVVTILFCDVKGSTALAGHLDPEEWAEIMNRVFDYMIAAVVRYEGTVARLMGDSILAFFGAPQAHEDDPMRAVLAGLDIISDLHPYQEEIHRNLKQRGFKPEPTDFQVRVGINTGLVVVGGVGSDSQAEYTAMGDAINVASRMEQTAQPGTVQITHDTYKLIAPLIDVEPLGLIGIKGRPEPLLAYQVIGLSGHPGRLRGIEGLASPLIGRVRELKLLRQRLRDLGEGSGHIVCLIGEAGLGKSRLISDLKTDCLIVNSDLQLRWYQTENLSFETNQPYRLFQKLLKRVFRLSEQDSPPTIRKKVTERLQDVALEKRSRISRAIEALFTLEDEETLPRLQGEAFKHDLFEGIMELGRATVATAPTVVVFDDLHWADPASAELLRYLLPLAEEIPVLFLCLFRPERNSPAWEIKHAAESNYSDHYLEIVLQPLSPQESNELVGNLLHINKLPEKVGALILEKTEGIPFFVEEIVRELMESGSVIPAEDGKGWQLAAEIENIHIPDNLEALLIARMDRLEENARRVLQLASVIGRSFYYRVLKLIADTTDQFDAHLQTLLESELILEAARIPEMEYMFRHALTQEAAYKTILRRRRRQYHRRTGEIIQQLFADRLDDYAPLLAHHFDKAGDNMRALKYLILAGERASRLFANNEAVMHYTRAIEVVDRGTIEPISMAKLHRRRGRAFETLGAFDQARADHETALQIGRQFGIWWVEWRALLDLGRVWASRDYFQTGDYFRKALALAREKEDLEVLGTTLNWMGNWYANAEKINEAISHHQEALEIFEELDKQQNLADTLDFLGMANLMAADMFASNAYFERAIALYRELDDQAGLASSLTSRGILGPEYDNQTVVPAMSISDGLKDIEEALKITQEIGWRAGEAYANFSLSWIYEAWGQFGQALDAARNALRIANQIGHHQWMTGALATIGNLHNELLAPEEGKRYLEKAQKLAQEIESQFWIHIVTGSLAKVYLLLDDQDRATMCLEDVIKTNIPMDTIGKRFCWIARAELALFEGDATLTIEILDRLVDSAKNLSPDNVITTLWKLRGEALSVLGQYEEAETVLKKAVENARANEEISIQWQIHSSLGKLYHATNRYHEAEDEFSKGKDIVANITSSIPDKGLRENFIQKAESQLQPPT